MQTSSKRSHTYRFLVSGRVQGVGFRWFVLRTARSLRLSGWVGNLRDGRVDVVAQGTSEMLDEMERQLAQGPPMSNVENVEKGDVTSEVDKLNSFEVR